MNARRWFGGALVAGAIAAGPASAQDPPTFEFGVDLRVQSAKTDGIEGRLLQVSVPGGELRIGIVSKRGFMLEPRLSFFHSSRDGLSSTNLLPGLNVLWRMGESATHMRGVYLTGGASVWNVRSSTETTSLSRTQYGLNAGVGHRKPIGSAAIRTEFFYSHFLKSSDPGEPGFAPASSAVGLRLGLSFWN